MSTNQSNTYKDSSTKSTSPRSEELQIENSFVKKVGEKCEICKRGGRNLNFLRECKTCYEERHFKGKYGGRTKEEKEKIIKTELVEATKENKVLKKQVKENQKERDTTLHKLLDNLANEVSEEKVEYPEDEPVIEEKREYVPPPKIVIEDDTSSEDSEVSSVYSEEVVPKKTPGPNFVEIMNKTVQANGSFVPPFQPAIFPEIITDEATGETREVLPPGYNVQEQIQRQSLVSGISKELYFSVVDYAGNKLADSKGKDRYRHLGPLTRNNMAINSMWDAAFIDFCQRWGIRIDKVGPMEMILASQFMTFMYVSNADHLDNA